MKADERAPLFVIRTRGGLIPASAYDEEAIGRYPLGQPLQASLWQSRSEALQRFYWATLGLAVENTERYRTAEDLHSAIKAELRYIDSFVVRKDSVEIRTRSTSFDHMDELEFRRFVENAMVFISTVVMPGVDISALRREAMRQAA